MSKETNSLMDFCGAAMSQIEGKFKLEHLTLEVTEKMNPIFTHIG